MAVSLGSLMSGFEDLWPIAGAEDWDSPGLIVGSSSDVINRVLLTVDVTDEVMEEAIDGEFDLIVAHHPFLFRGITSVSEQTAKGNLLSKAIRNKIAIYSAHTNADIVEGGVSASIAKSIGLGKVKPLLLKSSPSLGHGRIGELDTPIALGSFAKAIAGLLPPTATGVRVAGDYDQMISSVSLCGGAGDSFIQTAYEAGADVYITSDLRHHPVQEILETAKVDKRNFALIDISHWAAEWLWLEYASNDIRNKFTSLQIIVSEIRTDPWDFSVTQ